MMFGKLAIFVNSNDLYLVWHMSDVTPCLNKKWGLRNLEVRWLWMCMSIWKSHSSLSGWLLLDQGFVVKTKPYKVSVTNATCTLGGKMKRFNIVFLFVF
jgi:hypothetical protein